jgi:hypothetical protein
VEFTEGKYFNVFKRGSIPEESFIQGWVEFC